MEKKKKVNQDEKVESYVKGQDKTPEKQLNEVEIGKLPEKEFIWISSNEMDESGAHYTEWSKPER